MKPNSQHEFMRRALLTKQFMPMLVPRRTLRRSAANDSASLSGDTASPVVTEGPAPFSVTTKANTKKKVQSKKALPNKRSRPQTPEPPEKNGLNGKRARKVGQKTPTKLPSLIHASPSLLDRPVEPHATNAPLVTPHGSRLLAYKKTDVDVSPSKSGLPRPTTDTRHVLDEACAHLVKMDPKMKALIDTHHCAVFAPEGLAEVCDPFQHLCSGIMAQQVSGAAASSIKKKFISLFSSKSTGTGEELDDPHFPLPEQVAACSVPFLRTAGLSERKAEYIQGLAQKFVSGELSTEMLIKASDEEVLEKLIAVRGLGRWSVEMFACFGLKRLDILSTGDLGVQ